MSYNAEEHYPQVDRVFAPPMYSEATLRVIRQHLGENPTVVVQGLTPEDLGIERWHFSDTHGKNNRVVETAEQKFQAAFQFEKRVVEQALRRFYDLDDLQEMGQQQWVGTEAVASAIDKWEKRQERYLEAKRSNPQGIGHHPEMYMYDSRNRRHQQAPGTDVARPRRYDVALFEVGAFSPDDFTKDLTDEPVEAEEQASDAVAGLREGDDFRGCPVCSYQKQYDPESHIEYNRAGQAVMQHMRMVKANVDEHREALIAIKNDT